MSENFENNQVTLLFYTFLFVIVLLHCSFSFFITVLFLILSSIFSHSFSLFFPSPLFMDLHAPIHSLKHIGPLFHSRFLTHSFWPPHSLSRVPLPSLHHLLSFVASRHATKHSRRNLSLWLSQILSNPRARQCVPPSKIVDQQSRFYHVRDVNEYAWNAIVTFLRSHVPHHLPIYSHLPVLKRGRALRTKYPPICYTQ